MNTLSDLATIRLKPGGQLRSVVSNALLRRIYYYRKTALYVFLSVIAIGLIVALVMPARYRSEARLLALTSDSYNVQSDASAPARSELFKPDDVVNLEMQLLSSHDLHRAAVAALPGAPTDPMALEKTREKFTSALSVTRVSGANVIELALTERDPARAEAALKALIDSYYGKRAQVLTSGRSEMFEKQRADAEQAMAQANQALRAFQAAHGIADIDAQIAGAVSADSALRQNRSEASADLSGTAGSLHSLRRSTGSLPRTVEMYRDDTEAARAISESQGLLAQAEAKRADLAGRYMAGSPLLVQADQQIAGLRTAIAGQRRDLAVARRIGRNGILDSAQEQVVQTNASRAGLIAKRAQLGAEIGVSGARLLSLNGLAGRIAELKQARDAAQDRYRLMSAQVAEARSRDSEVMNGSTNVRVIQQPDLPTRRSNSLLLLLVGAIVAGIVLAAAALFIRITTRRVVLDASDAAASTGTRVIADLREPNPGRVSDLVGARERFADLAAPVHTGGQVIALLATSAEDYDASLLDMLRPLRGDDDDDLAIIHFEASAYGSQHERFAALTETIPVRSRIQVSSAIWGREQGEQLLSSLRKERGWIVLLGVPVMDHAIAGGAGQRMLEKTVATADSVLLVIHAERTFEQNANKVAALTSHLDRPLSGLIVTGRRIVWPRALEEG